MGMPASTAITLIGVGLFLTTFRDRQRQWASILGTLAFCICTLSLTGYLFGANQLYAIPRYTGIALQTATMVAALGIGVAAIVPEHGFFSVLWRKDAGGVVLRRLSLPLIVLAISLGWIRVLGQDMGLYDTAFGTAVRTLVEIVLLLSLLWWTARDISDLHQSPVRPPRPLPTVTSACMVCSNLCRTLSFLLIPNFGSPMPTLP
jgi:hypothetical protein